MILEAIGSTMLFGLLFIAILFLMTWEIEKHSPGLTGEQLKAKIPSITYYSYPILLIILGTGYLLSVIWVICAIAITPFGA